MADDIKINLQLGRKAATGMDCWSNKSQTVSLLSVTASFHHPSCHQPIRVLLNVAHTTHPHAGDTLADKMLETLKCYGTPRSKVLMVVMNNRSNMLKAVRMANNMKSGTLEQDDYVNETEEKGDEEEEDRYGEEENERPMKESDLDNCVVNAVNLHSFPCISYTLQ
jgi:hypothetical protein